MDDKKNKNFISVVVPAYNSALFIEYSIKKLINFLSGVTDKWEIIAVNDGSTDSTDSILRNLAKQRNNLIIAGRTEQKGKGFSVKEGVLRAKGDFIFFIDADLPYELKVLENMMFFLKEEYDVVIVSRVLPGSFARNKANLFRRMASRVFRIVIYLLTRLRIKDTQAGFKGFRRGAAERIFPSLTTSGFAFDIEILLLAKNMGLKIKEVPAILDGGGISSINLARESFRMVYDLIRIVRRHKI
ncbi:MAG: glycosyltransferase [Candidatus Niyogibacteria bacterium]|nr:glycosyltransferase [Candidatus Niyogibacteria bacterium]